MSNVIGYPSSPLVKLPVKIYIDRMSFELWDAAKKHIGTFTAPHIETMRDRQKVASKFSELINYPVGRDQLQESDPVMGWEVSEPIVHLPLYKYADSVSVMLKDNKFREIFNFPPQTLKREKVALEIKYRVNGLEQ